MALEKLAKVPSLVRKAGQAASKAQPFYSPVDQAIASITQGKGTGAQMLAELLKTKGVAKELKDRPAIKKALEQPKITKQELERVAAENPAAQVEETVLGNAKNDRLQMIEDRVNQEVESIVNDPTHDFWSDELRRNFKNVEEMSASEKRDALEQMMPRGEREREVRDAFGAQMRERAIDNIDADVDFDARSSTKFAQYTIPGGENYREVLIRLPKNQIISLPNGYAVKQVKADPFARTKSGFKVFDDSNFAVGYNKRRVDGLYDTEQDAIYGALESINDGSSFGKLRNDYKSPHFNEPNILAHARVSDRVGPNGEKILHIEEIQSDWHQEGRKKGYQSGDAEKVYSDYLEDLKSRVKEDVKKTMMQDGVSEERALILGERMAERLSQDPRKLANYFDEGDRQMALHQERIKSRSAVPDAPFKQNWHELVMKRLLDDAARNGYDKVVITPGAEQAKRYDLSKHVEELNYKKNADGTYQLSAQAGGRGNMIGEAIDESELERHVGKDVAQKIINNEGFDRNFGGNGSVSQPKDIWKGLSGLDLQVGGEGMRGFYDQILPSYLNEYGKKYGARVGTYGIKDPNAPDKSRWAIVRDADNNYRLQDTHTDRFAEPEIYSSSQDAENAIDERLNRGLKLHSFDITPQMREDIVGRGMPLYQVAPPVAIGAGAAMQEEPAEYAGGGAIRKAAKALLPKGQQAVLPAAESVANLERFLAESKAPMRLYHGTMATEGGEGQEAIRRIKPSKEGSLGSGVYLTPNPNFANEYAHPYVPGSTDFASGNVLPVHAQIKNPLIINGSASNDPMIEALIRLGMDEAKASRMVERAYENKGYIGKEVETRARAKGYDGLLQYDRDGELSEVVSYNPSAVKSAIGNQGTYDLTDPDINKAGGGLIKKAAKALLPKGQQAVLPAAESAANLERFLAESAVRDRLYHGTGADVTAFAPSVIGAMGPGTYVTLDPKVAGKYSTIVNYRRPENHPNILPLHASVKKPFKISSVMNSGSELFLHFDPSGKLSDEEIIKKVRDAGYDAIHATKEGEINILDPRQLKSAIGNRGTYDITDPDINKAKGGPVTNDAMWMAVQNKQLRKKHGN